MIPHQPSRTIGTNITPLFYCAFTVDKHTSKKNQKRIYRNKYGSMFIGGAKESLEALDYLIRQFERCKEGQLAQPLEGPLRACFRFHYPNTRRGQITKRLMDLSNLYQGPEDALQKANIILDDAQIESHDGSCRVYGSKGKAIEVALYRHHQLKI